MPQPEQGLRRIASLQKMCFGMGRTNLLNLSWIVIDDQHCVRCNAELFGNSSQPLWFRLPAYAGSRKVIALKQKIGPCRVELFEIALIVFRKNRQEHSFFPKPKQLLINGRVLFGDIY